jgi:hypothetical protein
MWGAADLPSPRRAYADFRSGNLNSNCRLDCVFKGQDGSGTTIWLSDMSIFQIEEAECWESPNRQQAGFLEDDGCAG